VAEWRADFALMDARELSLAGLTNLSAEVFSMLAPKSAAWSSRSTIKTATGHRRLAGRCVRYWRPPTTPSQAASRHVIASGNVADEARTGRLGVVITATTARRAEWLSVIAEIPPRARLAVVIGGDPSPLANEGGSA
jgi:hypothetical protein